MLIKISYEYDEWKYKANYNYYSLCYKLLIPVNHLQFSSGALFKIRNKKRGGFPAQFCRCWTQQQQQQVTVGGVSLIIIVLHLLSDL